MLVRGRITLAIGSEVGVWWLSGQASKSSHRAHYASSFGIVANNRIFKKDYREISP